MVEHRPSTTRRQSIRLWAVAAALVQVKPCCFSCASVSLLQLLRGRPLFLFPCGFQVRAWRVVLDAGFLMVCPSTEFCGLIIHYLDILFSLLSLPTRLFNIDKLTSHAAARPITFHGLDNNFDPLWPYAKHMVKCLSPKCPCHTKQKNRDFQ